MPVDARRLIRKMRGGAQAHLIRAADGDHYVVKFLNNPQHRRILVNEWIASVFLRYLGISTPEAMAYARHVYHIYAIRTGHRQAWQDALQAQGIQTGIHYPTPVHLLPAFADLGYHAGQFPHAERAANEVLSLPMFAELTQAQGEEVARAVTNLATPQLREKNLAPTL